MWVSDRGNETETRLVREERYAVVSIELVNSAVIGANPLTR